jgi:hypothetical protein
VIVGGNGVVNVEIVLEMAAFSVPSSLFLCAVPSIVSRALLPAVSVSWPGHFASRVPRVLAF